MPQINGNADAAAAEVLACWGLLEGGAPSAMVHVIFAGR